MKIRFPARRWSLVVITALAAGCGLAPREGGAAWV